MAWRRLAAALALSTIGGIGLWSPVVVLPVIEAEFGVDRGGASLPYTMTMLAFAAGGVLFGRLADRFGIMACLILGAVMLCVGYAVASLSEGYWHYVLAQSLLIGGLGSSSTFAPLVADISHWFHRRRGIAVAIVASGNYLAGAIWPPVLQYAIEQVGWRETHFWIGILCVVAMLPIAILLRRRAPHDHGDTVVAAHPTGGMPAPPAVLQGLLVLAGIACCVAMSMPQVHIVAWCVDLGYGAARGAEMLSLMLGFGVVSRLLFGFVTDRIGALATLLLGSTLQAIALMLYVPFDSLGSLYVISAVFGLFQGGIVPSYA
ncbi:MAG TPA: MFS transporter, partial [Anaerolineae bacterium]|nr:MFS transporter [Anaerolineae bacterium]